MPDHQDRSLPGNMLPMLPGSTKNYQNLFHWFQAPFPGKWMHWKDVDPYAFPPVAILGKVVVKLQDHPCSRIILFAQHALILGPSGHVQPDPIVPAQSAQSVNSTIRPDTSQEPVNLNIHVWLLAPQLSRSMASLRQW